EKRKQVLAANPDFTIGDIAKETGRLWGDLTPKEKAPYIEKARLEKERHLRELKEEK
ncbi:High mobility group protein B2, partial [Caligus rogercresseyi]